MLFGTGAQPGARHRRSLARARRHRRRAGSARKRRDTRPALKLAQRVLADSTLPTPRSGDDQRLPAQRLGARRESPAARRHHVHAGTDYRRAAVESRRVVGPVPSDRSSRDRSASRSRPASSIAAPAAVNNVQVHLELDGRTVETQTITCRPARRRRSPFRRSRSARAFTRGTVRIGDDALKQDNAFHFVVSPAQRVPVLIVEPPRAPRDASLYLQKALSIGSTPAFQVDIRQATNR